MFSTFLKDFLKDLVPCRFLIAKTCVEIGDEMNHAFIGHVTHTLLTSLVAAARTNYPQNLGICRTSELMECYQTLFLSCPHTKEKKRSGYARLLVCLIYGRDKTFDMQSMKAHEISKCIQFFMMVL